MSDTADDELTPEQARTMGDASVGQRAELRQLLKTKLSSQDWRDQLFAAILADRGLSSARATETLDWLHNQASADQAEEIVELLRVRLAPGPYAKHLRKQIATGALTYDQADLALKDLRRLPLREFPKDDKTGKIRTSNVPAGQYAVKGTDARTRHYKVTSDVIGAHEVKRLNGPKRGRLIRTASEVEQILRQIAADPAAAAKLYATETKKCAAPQCNKPLWDKGQPGYEHGYGPDCWKKIVAARKIRDHQAQIPDAD